MITYTLNNYVYRLFSFQRRYWLTCAGDTITGVSWIAFTHVYPVARRVALLRFNWSTGSILVTVSLCTGKTVSRIRFNVYTRQQWRASCYRSDVFYYVDATKFLTWTDYVVCFCTSSYLPFPMLLLLMMIIMMVMILFVATHGCFRQSFTYQYVDHNVHTSLVVCGRKFLTTILIWTYLGERMDNILRLTSLYKTQQTKHLSATVRYKS